MARIDVQDVACECSSSRLASAPSESGRVLLCTECARAYLAPRKPITWSELERQLGRRTADLYAFGWVRSAVPITKRRTLPERAARAGRFNAAERSGAMLGFVFVVLLVLVTFKAVLS